MVSRARLKFAAAMVGVIGGSAVITDAIQHAMWGNALLACFVVVGCFAFVASLQSHGLPDPRIADGFSHDRAESLTVLVDEVPLPLLRFSTADGLQTVNRAARQLFRTDDLIVDPPLPLLAAVTRAEAGTATALALFGRTYAVGMSEFVTAKYATRLVSLTDIQSEVRMAEATALRDLLRVLSHEIMNSLTPVANLAAIARDYLQGETSPASHAARDALALLSERAEGLARFVEAYRSMARLPDPLRRPVNLSLLLRDVVLVFQQSLAAKNVAVELDLQPNCPTLDLDETLLTQALLNVLSNAAEAGDAKNTSSKIRVSLANDGNETRISISDNGCGVPETIVEQIFHAFVTTKPNGTGTGLNLARQIALAHGGDLVFLGARDGWSAVFAFILPASPRGFDVSESASQKV